MKKILLLAFALNCFIRTMSYGQCFIAGPKDGNAFTGNVLPGDQPWINPGNAKTSNGSYAKSGFVLDLLSVMPTRYLVASDYQFNIPANATIKGIQVDIQQLSDGINLLATISDEGVRLRKGGAFVGANKASSHFWPIFNSSYHTYGGLNDLWGTTWTPADINSPGFGVGISAQLSGLLMLLPSANVDHMRITVNYSVPPAVTSTDSLVCAGTTATLTANGGVTFSWTPSAGLVSTSGASVVANPTVTTTYTVTGTAPGCSVSNTISVLVNPVPVVSVSSASATSTICEGDSLSLSASGASSYTWAPSGSVSQVNASSVRVSPMTTTTYSVYATAPNGCTNAGSLSTFQVQVDPAPHMILNANNNTICSGGSTILGASGASTYSWSPPTGLSAVSGASVIANPTITTVYQVSGTSLTGCKSLAASQVTVTVNNTPTLFLNSTSPGGVICQGSSTALSAAGASSYSWSPATGLSATSGANVVASPSVTTIYTVTSMVSGSCSGSPAVGTITVSVNAVPTLTTAAATNTTICEGSSLPLTIGGASSYSWSPATGLNTTTGPSVIASPTVTTTYSVLGTSSNGCSNSSNPSVFTISVTPSPVLSLSSTSATNTICRGASISYAVSGGSTYSWSPSAGLSTTTGPIVIANPTATTVYTVVSTGTGGCTNTLSPLTFTLTVNSAPSVSVSTSLPGYSLCVGSNIPLQASGASSYTWSPSASLSSATGANVIASPSVTTVYTVVAESAAACTNTTSPFTITVTVNPKPVISLVLADGNDTLCLGKSTTINVAGSATSYTWSNGANGQSVTVTPTVSTVYNVVSTNSQGCTASGSAFIVVVDPVSLTVNISGYAVTTPLNTQVTSNVAAGALPNTPAAIVITQGPAHGTASISNGVITYMPSSNYDGTDTVYYALCDAYCSTVCSRAKLVITIESDVRVPGILSPNGDGVHDHFFIKGLSKYANPELVIFNRWGNVVYSAKPYANDWDGQSSSNGLKLSGSTVLDGTYYYILSLEEGGKPLKGFFEVKRK